MFNKEGLALAFVVVTDVLRIWRPTMATISCRGLAQVLLALLLLLCSAPAQAQIVTDGLISYWTFDESDVEGMTVKDVWGENHGTMSREMALVQGKVGDAVAFDAEEGDVVDVPFHASFGDPEDLTVELWLRPDLDKFHCLAIGRDDGNFFDGVQHRIWKMGPSGGDAFYYEFFGFGNGAFRSPGDAEYTAGEWSHLAMTFTQKDVRKFYVNGALLDNVPAATLLHFETGIRFGARIDDAEWFAGVIDEARIYNRALTDAEIQQNFQAQGLAVDPPAGLAVTWGGLKAGK